MSPRGPAPLTIAQLGVRAARVERIGRQLGFVGMIEYRHVYSQSGGAQYGRGKAAKDDLLIAYAEAFDRDANPEDFSLTAILAHERGHQLLVRHPNIGRYVKVMLSDPGEEICAAILGSLLCTEVGDQDDLILQATAILADQGVQAVVALQRVQDLRVLFKEMLT